MPEADIIGALADKAPWLLPVFLILWMTRGEWKRIAGRSVVEEQADGALALLTAMNAATAKNLAYFEALTKQAEKWVERQEETAGAVRSLHDTQRLILNEMVRGNARGG